MVSGSSSTCSVVLSTKGINNDSSNGDFFSRLYLWLEDYEGEIQNAVKDAVRVALEVGILTSLS